jgi:hypothetical protein
MADSTAGGAAERESDWLARLLDPGTTPVLHRVVEELCGRCAGPAGPEGAWCQRCIAECKAHTLSLDLERLPELNSESLAWAAIFYARAGIPVHPLQPGSKVPATKNGLDDATTDLRLVRDFWRDHPDHNIGLATGHKFDALDIDVKDGRPGLDSFGRLMVAGLTRGIWASAVTPSGGQHFLFAPSGDGNFADARSGLDFRGLAGYIVASPSITDQGAYRWEHAYPDARGRPFDWAAAMEHLHGLAPRQPVRLAPPSSEYANPGPTVGKLAGICRKVAGTPPGSRDNILYWAYCRLVEGGYPPAAYDLVAQAGRAAGQLEYEIARALRLNRRVPS